MVSVGPITMVSSDDPCPRSMQPIGTYSFVACSGSWLMASEWKTRPVAKRCMASASVHTSRTNIMAARSRRKLCGCARDFENVLIKARNVFAAEFKPVGAFVSSSQLLNNYGDIGNYVFTKTLILKQVMVVCKSK